MSECLFAFTPAGANPPYANLSRTEEGLVLTVRSPANERGIGGAGQITLPVDAALGLMSAIQRDLLPHTRVVP